MLFLASGRNLGANDVYICKHQLLGLRMDSTTADAEGPLTGSREIPSSRRAKRFTAWHNDTHHTPTW